MNAHAYSDGRIVLTATLLLALVGCGEPVPHSEPVSQSKLDDWITVARVRWDESNESSINGMDSAVVQRSEFVFNDGARIPLILWIDDGTLNSLSSGHVDPFSHKHLLAHGNIEWDSETKCPYSVHIDLGGTYRMRIGGSRYESDNGTTILLRNRDGKVETKQIAGLPSGFSFDQASLMKYAHENQEVVDFYSDDQASESPPNETQRE